MGRGLKRDSAHASLRGGRPALSPEVSADAPTEAPAAPSSEVTPDQEGFDGGLPVAAVAGADPVAVEPPAIARDDSAPDGARRKEPRRPRWFGVVDERVAALPRRRGPAVLL